MTISKEIAFSALVRGRPPRCGGQRRVLVRSATMFEIEEHSVEDTMVAFRTYDPDGEWDERRNLEEYRLVDGRLFRSAGRSLADFVADELPPLNVTTLGTFAAFNRILRHEAFRLDGMALWPAKAREAIGNMTGSDPLAEGSGTAEISAFEHDGDTQTDLDFHEAMIKAAAADTVSIDGHVWVATKEPCYVVNARFTRPLLQLTHDHPVDRLRSGVINTNDWDRFRDKEMYFGHADRELALDTYLRWTYIDQEGEARAGLGSVPIIENLLPEIASRDFRSLELERVARLLEYDVADALRSNAHGGGVEALRRTPSDLLHAWAELRDLLPSVAVEQHGVPPLLEDALARLDQCVVVNDRHDFRYRHKLDGIIVGEVIRHYYDRPVALEINAAARIAP
jgi:hypothetical protein